MNLKGLNETLSRILTAPLVPVEDPVRRRQIKLLSALLLFLIVNSLLYAIFQRLTYERVSEVFYWLLLSNAVLIGGYILNRRGRFIAASRLSVGFITLALFISGLLGPRPIDDRYMFVTILPVLISSMLLSLCETLAATAANLTGIIAFHLLNTALPLSLALPSVFFFLSMSALSIVFIHHRNRAEEERRQELEEQEERYRSLVENINEAIFSIDAEGVFTFVSPAAERIWNFSPAEIMGRHYSILFSGPHRAAADAFFNSSLTGKTCVSELTTVSKSGLPLSIRSSIRPLKNRDRIVGVAGVATDITEQKKLEDQLRQAQKMESIGRLAGGIAHDFNNLLTVIKGYCEMMQNDEKLEPTLASSLSGIRTAAERGASLTQQLLAFSRKQIVQMEILNLNIQVTGIRSMLERIIGEHVTLNTILAPGLGNVSADANQLEQVIMNLAVNAVDAMDSGGQLTIETANVHLDNEYCSRFDEISAGDYVMLSVRDTGCGFDEKTAESIFEPFFTTKKSGKGVGLGLATVYGIVKQHNGHICFQSRPGEGSIFKIFLPEADEPIMSGFGYSKHDTGAFSIRAIKGRETLMAVEDESGLREVIVQSLKEYGYTVYSAANGSEALELCRSLPEQTIIDLLISDVVMPGINGKELADRMKFQFPHMKVLLISGYAKKTILNQGIPLENMKILMKPFSPKALVIKIREILNNP